MWMLLLMGIMFVGIMGVCLYGWWNNRQVDKYNEEHKQETA
jgi:hypothetical protein